MEALEEKYVRHDSFEEVDRILTIVENARSEYKKSHEKLPIVFTTFGLIVISSVGLIIFINNKLDIFVGESDAIKVVLYTILVASAGLLLGSFWYVLSLSTQLNRKEDTFERTTLQAVAILREVIPTLSRSENWSILKRFELRLRMAKLGINSEAMFSENDF